MSKPYCGRLPQRFSDDENEVGSPRVMVTSTTAFAARGLAQFVSRTIIGSHDMRQLMQARAFACTDVHPVVRADFHAALTSISATTAPAARNGYRVTVGAERRLEPFHLLDGMNVRCTTPIIYDLIIRQKYRAS